MCRPISHNILARTKLAPRGSASMVSVLRSGGHGVTLCAALAGLAITMDERAPARVEQCRCRTIHDVMACPSTRHIAAVLQESAPPRIDWSRERRKRLVDPEGLGPTPSLSRIA